MAITKSKCVWSAKLSMFFMFCCKKTWASLRLPCGIGHAILFSSCGFFFLLLSFFLVYSQPSHIGCLPYFHTWCGLSANLRCMSETCCTRLAENTGRKNRQKFAIWAPSRKFVGLYFATKARIDNRKKTC